MKISPEKLYNFLGMNTQGDLGGFTFYTSKDKGLVWFHKAPPLKPASYLQRSQRNKWRLIAQLWRSLTTDQQGLWMEAGRKAHLWIHGYNLWVYVQSTRDVSILETIENQTGITLPLGA